MQHHSATEIVAEARTWIGTPYVHQHGLRGVAVDCVGLILGVGRALEIMDWSAEKWAPFRAYGRTPNPDRMRKGMELFLTQIARKTNSIAVFADAKPGMVVWLQWREGLPMHLGIVGEFKGRLTLIHAYQGLDRCTEHGFTDP